MTGWKNSEFLIGMLLWLWRLVTNIKIKESHKNIERRLGLVKCLINRISAVNKTQQFKANFKQSNKQIYTRIASQWSGIRHYNWALSWENLSSGFRRGKTQTGLLSFRSLEISSIETRGSKLSRQRTTKALIRLCGCAGWSVPLFFAYGKNRFSHDGAQFQSWSNEF